MWCTMHRDCVESESPCGKLGRCTIKKYPLLHYMDRTIVCTCHYIVSEVGPKFASWGGGNTMGFGQWKFQPNVSSQQLHMFTV